MGATQAQRHAPVRRSRCALAASFVAACCLYEVAFSGRSAGVAFEGKAPAKAFSMRNGNSLARHKSPAKPAKKRVTIPPAVLTQLLTDATSANHLLFLVEKNARNMNENHIDVALQWLARSAAPIDEPLGEDPGFMTLLGKTSKMLTTFKAQALSNTLWSFAKVDYDPGEKFVKEFLQASRRQIPWATPQDLVNSLWACAKLNHHPGDEYLQAAVDKSARMLSQFAPTDLAKLLWSCARLKYHPGDDFLVAALQEARAKVNNFNPADLADILWGCAKLGPVKSSFSAGTLVLDKSNSFLDLGYEPATELVQPLLLQAEKRIADFEARQIAGVLWSCSKLNQQPSEALLQALPKRLSQPFSNKDLTAFGPRGLSFVLWIYAELDYNPGEDFMRRVITKLARTVPSFGYCGPEGLAGTLWACAKFGYELDNEMLEAIMFSASKELEDFDSDQLASFLWASAKLNYRPSDRFLQDWLQQANRKLESFKWEQLSMSLGGSSMLGFADGTTLMQGRLSALER